MKKKEFKERPEVKMKLDSILEDYIYFFYKISYFMTFVEIEL
jgi:hypothetical protein